MRIRPCKRLHTPKRAARRKCFRNNASPNGGQCATVIVAQSLLIVRHTLLDATQQLRHHQRVEKLCANCGALLECRQEAGCWCAELPHIPMPAEPEGCLCRNCLLAKIEALRKSDKTQQA